jgi:hypothetical protein
MTIGAAATASRSDSRGWIGDRIALALGLEYVLSQQVKF